MSVMWQSFWPKLVNGTWTFYIDFILFLLLMFLSNKCFLGSILRCFKCHCLCCKQKPMNHEITSLLMVTRETSKCLDLLFIPSTQATHTKTHEEWFNPGKQVTSIFTCLISIIWNRTSPLLSFPFWMFCYFFVQRCKNLRVVKGASTSHLSKWLLLNLLNSLCL